VNLSLSFIMAVITSDSDPYALDSSAVVEVACN
jgi:hypothetical protein